MRPSTKSKDLRLKNIIQKLGMKRNRNLANEEYEMRWAQGPTLLTI